MLVLNAVVEMISGQPKSMLGGGLSICRDFFDTHDPAGALIFRAHPTTMIHFSFTRKMRDPWRLATGLSVKGVKTGFGIRNFGYSSGNDFPLIMLPIELAARFPLESTRVSIVPYSGIFVVYNTNYGLSSHGSGFSGDIDKNDTLTGASYSYVNNFTFHRFLLLYQLGAAAEYQFRNGSVLAMRSGFNYSFMKFLRSEISYRVDKGPLHHATMTSDGVFWEVLGFFFHYPVGKSKRIEAEH